GKIPGATGTYGALAGLPIAFFLSRLPPRYAILILILLIFFSIVVAHLAEPLFGQKDPKDIVIDEIAGMAVALYGLPFSPFYVIFAFAGFRVFDILKPPPIRWIDQQVSGGFGIVLDDVVAGLFTNVILSLVFYLRSSPGSLPLM
nr:phosphatidylglycerophosphatase A [Deltaproteobacteria bacterium]